MRVTSAQSRCVLVFAAPARRQPLPDPQPLVVVSRHNIPAQGSNGASATPYMLPEKRPDSHYRRIQLLQLQRIRFHQMLENE